MVKKLLFGLVAIAFAGAVSAQKVHFMPTKKPVGSNVELMQGKSKLQKFGVSSYNMLSPMAVGKSQQVGNALRLAPMQRADEERSYMWWSYPQSSQGSMQLIRLNSGNDYNVALIVPETYAGTKIDSVELFFSVPEAISNLKVWASSLNTTSLPATAEEADYHFDVPTEKLLGPVEIEGKPYLQETGIEFPEPYTVPEGGCILGYSFTNTPDLNDPQSDQNYPLVLYYATEVDGSFLVYGPINEAGDLGWGSMYGSGYGNLAMNICFDVTGQTSNSVAVGNISELPARLNEETEVIAAVANEGFSPVNSINYILTVNGVAAAEAEYTFDEPLAAQSTDYVYLPCTPTVNGLIPVQVTVTKVNGVDNTSATATASGNLIGVANPYDRTSVVEEFTGTWCGWCPRGHVGMDMLKQKLGGKVITLAGHFSQSEEAIDPMQCDNYFDVAMALGASFPSAGINRLAVADPYKGLSYPNDGVHYTFGGDVAVQLVDAVYPSEASVDLSAEWASDAKEAINVTVNTTFGYDRMTSPYALAFVLVEDGMTGTTDAWDQFNYYSPEWAAYYQYVFGEPFTKADPYKNDDMAAWTSAGMYVDHEYDHVVVEAWDALSGIEESIYAPIYADDVQEYTGKLSIAGNTLIQNKDNLSLAVLLINRNNGAIVNASQVPLGSGSSVVGIEDVDASGNNAVEVARYNVNGVQLSAPQKGLNIVKYSDGTTKKVVVK